MDTIAYVYKWTHLPTLKWYVGSRSAKGCHPNDGYICSSKTVKPLILENSSDWVRSIISTGSPFEMRLLEEEILATVDAMNDPRSFNKHNATERFSGAYTKGYKHSEKTIEKRKIVNAGENNPMYGRKHSEETKQKIREKRMLQTNIGMLGRKHTPESIEKMKISIAKKKAAGA